MIDQQIDIATKDGKTTTFITHPERGGPFPVIIFYMDAPAIREELRDMARRLGTSGYYVMLPNMYYRSGVMELGPIPPDPEAPERKQMFGYMNSINIPMVMEDTKALLAFAETQEAANTKIVGTVGYCMSLTARIWPRRRPRLSSISPAPRPTSMRRRKLSTR
jgi:carboxymethylenebutenolidase